MIENNISVTVETLLVSGSSVMSHSFEDVSISPNGYGLLIHLSFSPTDESVLTSSSLVITVTKGSGQITARASSSSASPGAILASSTFASLKVTTVSIDIASLVSDNQSGSAYVLLGCATSATVYTEHASLKIRRPLSMLKGYSIDDAITYNEGERVMSYPLGGLSLSVDTLTGAPSVSIRLFDYKDAACDMPIILEYSHSRRDSASPVDGFATGFPKGFKLNVDRFLSMDSDDPEYVGPGYRRSHLKRPKGAEVTDLFYDPSGSYLVFEGDDDFASANGPLGEAMRFTNGRMTLLRLRSGNSYRDFQVSHDSLGRISSVSSCGEDVLQISYDTTSIALLAFGRQSKQITICLGEGGRLSSISCLDGSLYIFSYDASGRISSISLSAFSISIGYGGQSRVSSVTRLGSTGEFSSDSFAYSPYHALVCSRILGQGGPTTERSIYFGPSGEISSVEERRGGSLSRVAQLFEDGRLSYSLDTSSALISDAVVYSGNQIDLAVTPISVVGSASFRITGRGRRMSFLLIGLHSSAQTPRSEELTFSATAGGVSLLQKEISVDFATSYRHILIPIEDRRMAELDASYLDVSVSRQTLDLSLSITDLRIYGWDGPVVYFRDYVSANPESIDYIYADNATSIGQGMMPFELSRSASRSFPTGGSPAVLEMFHDDLVSSMLHLRSGREIVFGSHGFEAATPVTGHLASIGFQSNVAQEYSFGPRRYGAGGCPYGSVDVDSFLFVTGEMAEVTNTMDFVLGRSSSRVVVLDESLSPVAESTDAASPSEEGADLTEFANVIVYRDRDDYGNLIQTRTTSGDSAVYGPYSAFSQDGRRFLYKKSLYVSSQETLETRMEPSYLQGPEGEMGSISYGSGTSAIQETRQYDSLSRPASVSRGQSSSQIAHDSFGVSTVSSAGSRQISFAHDWLGVSSIIHAGRSSMRSLSLESGCLAMSETSLNGVASCVSYDAKGRVISRSKVVRSTAFSYESSRPDSRVSSITASSPSGQSVASLSYDMYGSVSLASDSGVVVSHSSSAENVGCSNACHLTSSAIQIGALLRNEEKREYPIPGIAASESTEIGGKRIESYSLTEPPQSTHIRIANGVSTLFDAHWIFIHFSDPNGKTSPIVATTRFKVDQTPNIPFDVHYRYYPSGYLSTIHSAGFGFSYSYEYDSAGRVVKETNSPFGVVTYSYDVHGNMVGRSLNGAAVMTASYGEANEISSLAISGIADASCEYDENGLPTKHKGNAISLSSGLVVGYGSVSFGYDGFGRRVSKSAQGSSTAYTYLGGKLLRERISRPGESDICIDYAYSGDEIIGIRITGIGDDDGWYAFCKDALGNVIGLFGEDAHLIATYAYDAYGTCRVYAANGSPLSNRHPGIINPIRYRSYYYDNETCLYLLGERFYDPELGRFITPDDPSYIKPYEVYGSNLYIYCQCNPVMYIDNTGHSAVAALLIAIGVGALAGLAGQLTADVIHGITTGNWEFRWEQYLGACVGGAIGGLLYVTGVGGFLAGFITSAATTFIGNGLEMLTGSRNADWSSLAIETIASGIIGGIGGTIINVKGINLGSHSLHQIYKSGLTKVWRYGLNMSAKTMIKGFAMSYYTSYANTLYNALYSFAEDRGYISC